MVSQLLLLLQALALLPSAALSVPLAANSRATLTEVTLGVVLPEHNVHYLWAWPRVGPTLQLTLEALENELRDASLAIHPVFSSSEKDGNCSLDLAWENSMKLKASEDPDVLLGLGCSYTDSKVRGLAQEWRLPLLSAGDYEGSFAFTTTVYSGPAGHIQLMDFLEHLQKRFGWTSRFVYAFSHHAQDFQQNFQLLQLNFDGLLGSDYLIALDNKLEEALQSMQARGRVAYIHGSPEMVQQMMRLAQAQHMTNGDYVFIYLDLLGESLEAVGHREAAKPWQSKESPDSAGLREAFQTVLIITFHQPQTPEYQRFQSELILRAQRDFGVSLNDSLYKNLVAGCFHDGLLLYIRALIETLHEGGSKRNTSLILEKMRSLEIQGVTGTVSIDEFNEREADFDLWSMADMQSGQYQVVGRYVGTMKQIVWLGPIHWKQGAPPLDDPPCVFSMDYPSCSSVSSQVLISLWSWFFCTAAFILHFP